MPDLTPDDDAMREFAAALFTDPDEPAEPVTDEAPDPLRGNVAPKEGTGTGRPTYDDSMRVFTAQLFGHDPHA